MKRLFQRCIFGKIIYIRRNSIRMVKDAMAEFSVGEGRMRLVLAVCLWVSCIVAPAFGTDVFSNAQWLRDPVFKGVATIDLHLKEKAPAPKLFGPQDVHTLFRKEVTLKAAPASALLAITGDDYYYFYVNGARVVQGPEQAYPWGYNYYWLDITEFLQEGVNCLAAHSYYHGLRCRAWHSADNRSGFMLDLQVTYPDGSTDRFFTDDSWRCFQLQAFPQGKPIGYDTQFPENIDMRLIPPGWRMAGFDESAWLAPLIERQDHQLIQQLTPPVHVTPMRPAVTKKLGEGHYFYDFGTEIVGHTRIRVKGTAGQTITVRHGEELSAPDTVRYEMRAKCVYEEKPVLSGRDEVIEFYEYRAFRYIELLDVPGEPELWVDVRHHPFDSAKSTFTSSNSLLTKTWTICRNGVRMGAQGGFLDCPSREKGQYLGDALITGRAHLWLTGDPSLNKKALNDFALSQRICPGIMAVAPGSFMQEIAEYSLQYPLVLAEYYRQSGDRAFTEATAEAVFPGLFDYFARFENADGLIENMTEKWVLVDWPENLRDGYDYDYAKEKANTVMNAFYYGALRTAAALLRDLGRDGAAYDAKAERVADAFAARMVDPATGLYVDAPGSKHSSLHANAVPLCFGLTKGADPAKMIELIRQKRLSCGVYIASFVIEACFRNGAGDLGFELLTSKDEHSWNEMLKAGATACLEAWGPDQKWNTSWCHPWASCPLYLLPEYVLGLSPAEPGWAKIRVAPVKIANLPAMTLRVPHPKGTITARYTPGLGYAVTVPQGVPFEVQEPEGVPVNVQEEQPAAQAALTAEDIAFLQQQGWDKHVISGLGVWISVERQRMYLIAQGNAIWQAPCATATAGTGAAENSQKTPLGWHHVVEKIGEDAPWGQVFESRQPINRVWSAGQDVAQDLVLTRVVCLAGDEPGRNQGKNAQGVNVDSRARHIYIHGTNDEAKIGTPSSHGCIRLKNDDVIAAFERIPYDTPVLITE